jgi:hypothetical protein
MFGSRECLVDLSPKILVFYHQDYSWNVDLAVYLASYSS